MNFREKINILKKYFLKKTIKESIDENIPECLEFLLNNNEEEHLLQATAVLFSKIYPITKKLLERPNENNSEYLLCHLRNDEWLAHTNKKDLKYRYRYKKYN